MNFLTGGKLAAMLAALRASNKMGTLLADSSWRGLGGPRSSLRMKSQNRPQPHWGAREMARRRKQMQK